MSEHQTARLCALRARRRVPEARPGALSRGALCGGPHVADILRLLPRVVGSNPICEAIRGSSLVEQGNDLKNRFIETQDKEATFSHL